MSDDQRPAPANSSSPAPPMGVLVVDKATGFTSMDVCAIVRGRLRRGGAAKGIKVGHGGTLDPLATGVLVVLVGKATRLCDQVMAGEKEYLAEIDLAHTSNTDDAEGLVTPVTVTRVPSEPEVQAAAARFVGDIMQTPPAFSALNVGGVRAYDLARKGREVRLAPRPVHVETIDVLAYDWPKVRIRVVCGKGTYIRSLARDLGAALGGGVGGMLTALRRTRVGRFTIDAATTLDHLPNELTQAHLQPP